MVSPNINKKQISGLAINDNTKKLFQVIYQSQNKEEKYSGDTPKIKVSSIISKMAFYYEKIRNSVDYKEEYLLRKNAIERILKRQIVIEGVIRVSKSDEIAKMLLIELIRAGYLPNDEIPEKKIDEIGQIMEKYIKLKNYSLARISPGAKFMSGDVISANDDLRERAGFMNWIIALAASEIEENLGLDKEKQVAVSNMYDTLSQIIKLPADLPYDKDLEIQIYLGIHRNYLKFDKSMLEFIVFKYYNVNWKKPKDEEIAQIAANLTALMAAIDRQMNHALAKQLNKIILKYSVFFSILSEVVENDPTGVYSNIKNDPKAFPRQIKNVCAKKYKEKKSKLWRAAVRSIIYIFLTKSIFAFILEVPAIKWFGEEVNLTALAINVTFPALLLFVIVFLTRVPTEDNTEKIAEGIEEIIFEGKAPQESFVLKKPIKRSGLTNLVFGLIYAFTFFLSFGTVVWALDRIGFNWVSTIIFLFFLALVSFFSIRIRKGIKELAVIEPKENIFSFLIDFFYVPIVSVGKWLSEKFSQINLFVFILDFIIEAPFKIFVEIAEDWTKYVRERKEEIV
ncbi:hypothetical protein COV49_04045 [Candidatus Falkowbacteria bacterium CG11_big_fil_rev_8_21_14_0_20_39_10]|uniref:Uncharacterized protein n=1 Tax=Candidatus Falkowbacteria bacterium CG11_big_fil_rev_8_21_14_0_20_39_10 TaxID=1974570 RepID=A0A2M6K8F1_9BACT|nr:MAG: hypothetical protein COV49_04045 [Candidatus Falkowbacteria bacterium CG11_big_fil_rev_8_21_14_0_20_39_10]